jgi:hypothetical protein
VRLDLGQNHELIVDCEGQRFDYQKIRNNLAMGTGSVLHFTKCVLLNYDFTDGEELIGSVSHISDSSMGFGSACAVRFRLYNSLASLRRLQVLDAARTSMRGLDNFALHTSFGGGCGFKSKYQPSLHFHR